MSKSQMFTSLAKFSIFTFEKTPTFGASIQWQLTKAVGSLQANQ